MSPARHVVQRVWPIPEVVRYFWFEWVEFNAPAYHVHLVFTDVEFYIENLVFFFGPSPAGCRRPLLLGCAHLRPWGCLSLSSVFEFGLVPSRGFLGLSFPPVWRILSILGTVGPLLPPEQPLRRRCWIFRRSLTLQRHMWPFSVDVGRGCRGGFITRRLHPNACT